MKFFNKIITKKIMKPLMFSLILITSFNLVIGLEIYYPLKTTSSSINYSWTGKIKLTNKLLSANITFHSLPENCEFPSSNFDYFSENENGRFAQKNLTHISDDINFYLNCSFKSEKSLRGIKNNPFFPEKINDSYFIYLNESEKIVINEDIKKLASKITSGANTTLEASAMIAEWVNKNIKYTIKDENHDYAESVLNSSEILKNKKGVCDEFSTMFLALTRAVGIPSRYVAGYASNKTVMGPHAWVQALIGGEWVDFDPTYGEYGFVDSTHITTFFSENPSFNPFKIVFTTINGEAIIENSDETLRIISYENDSQDLIKIKASFDKEKAGENEYLVLTINAQNTLNAFVLTTIEVYYNNERIELINDSSNDYLFLQPLKNTTKYYVFKTRNNFEKKYYYPTLVKIIAFGSKDVNASINIYPIKGEQSFEEAMSKISLQELKYRTGIEVSDFRIIPRVIYNNTFNLSFSFRNAGNKILENLKINISYLNYTRIVEVPRVLINEEKFINESLESPPKGRHKLKIFIENNSFTTEIIKAEKPNLSLEYVGNKTFYNDEPTNFMIKINGDCKNKTLILTSGSITKVFSLKNDSIANCVFDYYETSPENILINANLTCVDDHGTRFEENEYYYLTRSASGFMSFKIRIKHLINNIKNFLNTIIYK